MPDVIVPIFQKYAQFARFVIAGGLAFVVNIVVLYTLTDLLRIYYLISTVGAFLVSFLASFTLQKFWTFKDNSRDQLHLQLPLYLGMQIFNLGFNTGLMYVFVEYLHIWYIFAQFVITAFLAAVVFFVNKKYIFRS
ncbi:MAG: GtrA family protein [Patescibacteria group bacterium]